MITYRSEKFCTHLGLIRRLNKGIRPEQIVSITHTGREIGTWVLIYTEDGKNDEKK